MTDKIALLDVDGVVADFVGTLLREIDSELSRADITRYNIFELLGDRAPRAFDLCGTEAFWSRLDVVEYALQGVEKLRREGYEIFWVTRPWNRCHGWYDARVEWLGRNFRAPCRNIMPVHCKWIVDGDVFIDDRPEHVFEWWGWRGRGRGLIYDQPYNQRIDIETQDSHRFERFTWAGYLDVESIDVYRG